MLLPSPARTTYDSKAFFGALRVDRKPLHRINYTMRVEAGQEVAALMSCSSISLCWDLRRRRGGPWKCV